MKRTTLNYYNIYEDQVVYPASFGKRLTARLLDFFIALLIPMLISLTE